MPSLATNQRYHSAAIILHWVMAIGVIGMLSTGLYMVNVDMPRAEQFKLYQWHKAAGVIMLWAIVLRLIVRALHQPPALPTEIDNSNKQLAKIGHITLYAALIIMPVTGWFMVSASPFGLPTFVFVDWVKWPHIGFVERNKEVEFVAKTIHWTIAYAMVALVIGHLSALVWHKVKHRVNLLNRMWW